MDGFEQQAAGMPYVSFVHSSLQCKAVTVWMHIPWPGHLSVGARTENMVFPASDAVVDVLMLVKDLIEIQSWSRACHSTVCTVQCLSQYSVLFTSFMKPTHTLSSLCTDITTRNWNITNSR